ncbi:ankyrin repeat, SAM and basic leucine zipper domain-containing protein 1 [Papilio machaon]|uniref:ankyrin repeat, SAM and basic leucine zipper domain-containing protein 1 n=1 Tax=Papilio machaon TaxID=76193 RepID=UPI001E662A82|nr:ankyrin repeat, SAM and basic leucine zipper domain-containing protein 1 [Papilio machaon]
MAQFRPAGFSDEDTDSDDYGFFEKPIRTYIPVQNEKKKIENRLQDAILNGNLKEVEDIITYDLHNGVNVKLDSGWTPLMHASFHAQEDIVKFLLNKGADPNLHADSMTSAMAACSNSSADDSTIYNIISLLIEKGCLLNIGDKFGQTPLMRAISNGRTAVVQLLLDKNVNVEMRDQQGWTAMFWAVHHNKPDIVEILIQHGARLKEVDKSGRTPLEIANLQDYQDITNIIKKHLNINDDLDKNNYIFNHVASWHDFYPGLKNGQRPNYVSEIPNLLYGMNSERLTQLFMDSGMDLRTFLLLEEKDMIDLGVEMPYERQRLRQGLRNFHMRGWKLNAVAGLYTKKTNEYSVIDCLTTLGTHLYQMYILEATLQYTLREYNRIQNQIKYEPPDSPLLNRFKAAAKKFQCNINSIRKEITILRNLLAKVSKSNPQPADLIKEKTAKDIAVSYVKEIIVVCTAALFVYNAKNFVVNLLRK